MKFDEIVRNSGGGEKAAIAELKKVSNDPVEMGKLLIFLAKKREGDEDFLRKEEEREKTGVVISAVLDTVVDELTDAFIDVVHVERARQMDWEDHERDEKRKTAIRKFARRRRRQRRRTRRCKRNSTRRDGDPKYSGV